MFIICSLAAWLQLVHSASVAMALDHCRTTIRYICTTAVSQLVSVCAYAQRYHDIGINLRIIFNVYIGINLYYIMFNCGCMHLPQKIDVPQIVD